ncbi:response regulator transcription factor [Paenibacillus sp. WLX1005]|uniref:response regulator transcription factor n=1 Tax=Paenibacillus sp. WLX1005 TaxID=3243766 RepID=UPI003983FCB1
MTQGKILLVDDEPDIVKLMQIYLQYEGYDLLTATDGQQALEMIAAEQVDLMVLDVMMPRLDGIQTCMQIREKEHFPIIMLSAKGQDMDKITGLSVGADDYVTKPFNPLELVARIKSQLRRAQSYTPQISTSSEQIELGALQIDVSNHEVLLHGESVRLTPREFAILLLLVRHPGQVFSTEHIYQKVWKEDYMDSPNTVMVHIRKIREKIESNPRQPHYLKTVWGIGYKIENV